MRNLVRATLGALAVVVLSATGAAAQTPQTGIRLAYINSQRILEQTPGREAAEAQFEREMQGFRDELKRMGDSLNTMVADYNRQEVSLSPSARLNRQAQIREREEQYQRRAQEMEQRAAVREQELIRPLMQWIQGVIDTVRVAEGYHMILDAGAAGGMLVSADTSLDITDMVLERLRRGTPPTITGSAPASRQQTNTPATPQRGPQAAPAGVQRPRTP